MNSTINRMFSVHSEQRESDRPVKFPENVLRPFRHLFRETACCRQIITERGGELANSGADPEAMR